MKSKLTIKKEIEKNIDEFFNNAVKCSELTRNGKGLTYKEYGEDYWNSCREYQEAKLEQLKEDAEEELIFLEKLRKILNEYHSQIPMVEIGRENVLNDIDNEIKLDRRIKQLNEVIKKKIKR